jgi:hypothetical protein
MPSASDWKLPEHTRFLPLILEHYTLVRKILPSSSLICRIFTSKQPSLPLQNDTPSSLVNLLFLPCSLPPSFPLSTYQSCPFENHSKWAVEIEKKVARNSPLLAELQSDLSPLLRWSPCPAGLTFVWAPPDQGVPLYNQQMCFLLRLNFTLWRCTGAGLPVRQLSSDAARFSKRRALFLRRIPPLQLPAFLSSSITSQTSPVTSSTKNLLQPSSFAFRSYQWVSKCKRKNAAIASNMSNHLSESSNITIEVVKWGMIISNIKINVQVRVNERKGYLEGTATLLRPALSV